MSESKIFRDAIRTLFSRAMSAMYKEEVPAYGTLLDLVREVNDETLAADPAEKSRLQDLGELDRISEERHGAIRLGTASELAMMRRLFAVMGMYPVGYYDLSVAGVPVHSTAFRPLEDAALRHNPFRVFTSLLRLDLIEDEDLRAEAQGVLDTRRIYTDRCVALIEKAEADGGLTEADAEAFVAEALETFRWHSEANVGHAMYRRLHDAHRLVADVVAFKGPHINHLTPRTLDIDKVQGLMPEWNITPKAVIEGPPPRKVAILLRQTSFKALEEPVRFAEGIKATKAGKLPLDDADIAEHAEICGDLDRVREIAKGLKPGRLEHLGPGPMAVVNCNFNSDDYPVPVVEPDGDGFRLAPVKVSDTSSHSCQITPIGEFSLGEIVATLDGQTQTMPESGGDSGNTFKKLKGSPDWVGKSLVRAVSAETYKELERRELEHLIDFDYAFQIGPAALGDAINTAAGTTHETPEAALDALIELLKARGQLTFVPKTPEKPEAWRSRMAVVMASVSDGSKKRDRMGTHSPSDNIPVVRGKAVILTPVFKEESLKTKTIITLGEATPVYGGADAEDGDGEGEGAEFTVGETRTVKTAMSSVAFLHKVDGEDVYLDELKTGDNVRIESKADGRGMIWIRYDHPDVIEYELAKSATVYALVPAANLE